MVIVFFRDSGHTTGANPFTSTPGLGRFCEQGQAARRSSETNPMLMPIFCAISRTVSPRLESSLALTDNSPRFLNLESSRSRLSHTALPRVRKTDSSERTSATVKPVAAASSSNVNPRRHRPCMMTSARTLSLSSRSATRLSRSASYRLQTGPGFIGLGACWSR